MVLNPDGTKWSVAPMDANGVIGSFHPEPWCFGKQSMNAGTIWYGGYQPVPGENDAYTCEILNAGSVVPTDHFEVKFETADRFVCTKGGALYRFGKKV